MEEWRPVVGYEGRYEVSSHGRVRSVDREYEGKGRWGTAKYKRRGVYLSPIKTEVYLAVNLHKNGRREQRHIHRIVMDAFVGLLPEGMETRHLNGEEECNLLENLRYGTKRENEDDRIVHGKMKGHKHPQAKLSDADVFAIRKMRNDGYTLREIALKFSVTETSVSFICNRKTWAHI